MNDPEYRPYTAAETKLIRQRQSGRSRITAVLLFALCVLFFAITVAKIGYWG